MKVGILGAGMIVHDLLSFIHEIKDIQLIHISGTKRSEEKLKDIKEKYHFKRYSTSYQELLDDQEVDTQERRLILPVQLIQRESTERG